MSVAGPLLAIPLSLSMVGSLVGAPAAVTGEAPADAPATAPPEAPKEDPKLEQAMVSYDLGKQAYNAARYEDALEHFQEAATRYASPDFQYNIGLCYERLGKPEEAVRAFRTYLRAKPEAKDRANVEDRIFTLEKEIEEAKNEPPPSDASPQPDPPEPEPKQPPGRGLIITGATLAGVGAAVGLGGGIGLGIPARSRSVEVEDVISGGNPNGLTQEDAQKLEDEGRRFETLQITTAAIGGVIAVTGVALLAIGLKKRNDSASASATLVPTWSTRSAGLSLQGRF